MIARHRSTIKSFGETVEVAKTSYRNVSSFIILRSGSGLTVFNKNNRANAAAENRTKMKISKGMLSFFV